MPGTGFATPPRRHTRINQDAHETQQLQHDARRERRHPHMKAAAPVPSTNPVAPAGGKAAAKSAAQAAAEKNRPLVDDIRLLGRILGDVIREQEGAAAFELIERVRQLSVAYRLKRDKRAGAALDRLLKNLSGDQTVSVIRAFSYFSHLANIAEDRQHVRRREHHDRQGHRQEGSLATAFDRLAKAGIHPDAIARSASRMLLRCTSVGCAVSTGEM